MGIGVGALGYEWCFGSYIIVILVMIWKYVSFGNVNFQMGKIKK